MVLTNQQNGTEAQRFVWGGAIPLQIHLHESEVTTLPPPPPALILAPRVGYLPLLAPLLKPFFSSSLPPGVDTVWFEYKGLPLKWYISTGVLFDLLCAEPERPWNLTVHFRGYPTNILTPCEGEDSVKWSFINALKEAAYIINGNCKNIMNMSQSDQADLWRSVLNGQLEAYLHVAHKLKLNIVEDELAIKRYSTVSKPRQSNNDLEVSSTVRAGRIPVRLYIRSICEDIDDLEDVSVVDNWENISYINRPVDLPAEGVCFTLHDALKSLLPELFNKETNSEAEGERISEADSSINREEALETSTRDGSDVVLVRIQGIEPRFEVPFGWVVNNLMNPEHYLHVCVYVKGVEPVTIP